MTARRATGGGWILGCVLLACASASGADSPPTIDATAAVPASTVPGPSRAGGVETPRRFWIELDAPSEGELLRSSVGLLELRGRVGAGARGAHDVVIALDGSQSSLLPTGLDLDADGTAGDLRFPGRGRDGTRGPFERWTTDFDDVVAQGELMAAQRLIDRLDAERARVGVIRFSGDAQVIAPMGSVQAAREALDAWYHRADWTGSSLASGVLGGLELLEDLEPLPAEDPASPSERRRAVLLVTSDGLPTASLRTRTSASAPSPRIEQKRASAEAIRAAERARDAGVWVYAFEVHNQAEEDPGLLASMAELAAGRYVYVNDPASLRFELPNPSWAPLAALRIQNQSAGEDARAVRVFSNGEFDAFVTLREGRNDLRIEAELPSGERLSLSRSVYFERPETPHASDTDRVEALRDALVRRTEETRALPRRPRAAEPRDRSVRVQVPNGAVEDRPDLDDPGTPSPR